MKRILKIVLGTIGGLIALCLVGSIVGGRGKAATAPTATAAAPLPTVSPTAPPPVVAAVAAVDAGATQEKVAVDAVTAALDTGETCLKALTEATTKGDLDRVEMKTKCVEQKIAAATSAATSRPDKDRLAKLEAGFKVAQEAAIKKKRASREFLKLGPDALAQAILSETNLEEVLETKWQGRWVRWDAKFVVKAPLLGHLFNAGSSIEMTCDSFDPDVPAAKVEGLKRWQPVSMEARFTRPSARAVQPGERLKLVFDDCSFK